MADGGQIMSVTTEKNRMEAYTTNGVVTDFDFDLEIYEESEIEVWYRETGDTYSQLTLNTDYGVTFGDGAGTVTTEGFRAPLPDGHLLLIRHLDILQETNWFNNDSHSEDQHQTDFDRCIMIDLQQQEELDRCPKFLKSSDTKNITFPEPAAVNLIGWNEAGDDLQNMTFAILVSYIASILNHYEVPVIGESGMELLKPGNEAGDDGNWLIVVDSSGNLIFKQKVSGIWTKASTIRGA
jgi:AAA15 family ATPase/GTPase